MTQPLRKKADGRLFYVRKFALFAYQAGEIDGV